MIPSKPPSQEDETFLVIDFGGGTLDVSVVACFDQIVEILAVAGDNHLGGDDFDQRIAEHFCREHGIGQDTLNPRQRRAVQTAADGKGRGHDGMGRP